MSKPIEVTWDKQPSVVFQGRNGSAYCCGIELMHLDRPGSGGVINVQPFTSRGQLGNCRIEIPVQHLDQVIHALQSLQTKVKKDRPRENSK